MTWGKKGYASLAGELWNIRANVSRKGIGGQVKKSVRKRESLPTNVFTSFMQTNCGSTSTCMWYPVIILSIAASMSCNDVFMPEKTLNVAYWASFDSANSNRLHIENEHS